MQDEAAAAPLPPPDNPSSLARLWSRYKRARAARIGLVLVVFFTLVALFAPFLAHRLPVYWHQYGTTDPVTGDAVPGGMSWPLLREFLAPSDTTEPMLERTINFLFLFIPLAFLAWKGMNRYFPALRKMESRLISLLFGAMVSALLWLAIGGMVVDAGGKNWLYSENPPVPDVDDIVDVRIASRPSASSGVADILAKSGYAPAPDADDETLRRELSLRLQTMVEGPPLPADGLHFDTLDITDANRDAGINPARLNRLILESAYPGLLTPMRQFRGTFIAMVAVSAAVLLGLTYICLAGAWQFSLSPRCLVLLVLAALLALPFSLTARHNHTPYRQLAAEGKGWGIFPLIPYGPNENVFGPRLPPSWYVESPLLAAESVRAWISGVIRPLDYPPNEAAAALRRMLDDNPRGWHPRDDTQGRAAMVAALNTLIEGPPLADALVAPSVRGDQNIGPFLAALRAGRELTPLQSQRLNRLLLEKTLPGAFFPAAANHWKKPRDVDGTHVLGTDESGRDVLVRLIHGARVSLSVGFVSVFLATVIGLVMGSLAGYYGGRVDMLISRFLEIMMCFPSFFLILAVIAVLDRRSIVNIMLVIGLTSWTGVARLIRGEMLRHRKMDYVSASIALGASDTRTIFRHILPNAMAPVLVSISFGITGAILTEAGLSFIGFGVTPPTPTWGQLLSETRESPLANWWLAVFPGIVLFISVLAYNMVGEAVRDALDPRTTL